MHGKGSKNSARLENSGDFYFILVLSAHNKQLRNVEDIRLLDLEKFGTSHVFVVAYSEFMHLI